MNENEVEQHYKTTLASADIVISVQGGRFAIYACCSVGVGGSEGFGWSGPVFPPEHNYSDEQPITTWTDREAGWTKAVSEVARQAEQTVFEVRFHPKWRPYVAAEAQKVRAWLEYVNGAPIPEQFTAQDRAEREAFFLSIGKKPTETGIANETETNGQLTLF
jgi:hypothetical protein